MFKGKAEKIYLFCSVAFAISVFLGIVLDAQEEAKCAEQRVKQDADIREIERGLKELKITQQNVIKELQDENARLRAELQKLLAR